MSVEIARSLKEMKSFKQLAAVVADDHIPLSAKAIAGMVIWMAACAKNGDTLLEARDKLRASVADCDAAMPFLWDSFQGYT